MKTSKDSLGLEIEVSYISSHLDKKAEEAVKTSVFLGSSVLICFVDLTCSLYNSNQKPATD